VIAGGSGIQYVGQAPRAGAFNDLKGPLGIVLLRGESEVMGVDVAHRADMRTLD